MHGGIGARSRDQRPPFGAPTQGISTNGPSKAPAAFGRRLERFRLVDCDEELGIRPGAGPEEENTELSGRIVAVTPGNLRKANCRNRRVCRADRVDVRRYNRILRRKPEALETVDARLQRRLVDVRGRDVLGCGRDERPIRLNSRVGKRAAGGAGWSYITLRARGARGAGRARGAG